jgi:hypothetical protein
MVSTRSADAVGEKRAPSDDPERQPPKKQAKHKEQLELETGEGGEVGLKKEDQEKGWQDGDGQAKEAEEAKETEEIKDTAREGKTRDEGEKIAPTKAEDEPEERSARPERQSGSKASPGAKEATDVKSPPSGSLTEPKHGEQGGCVLSIGASHTDSAPRYARARPHLFPLPTQDRRRRSRVDRRYQQVCRARGTRRGA